MEPQLQRLYESGLRSFEATVASGRSFVRAGQQCRLRLPDGSQANFIAQTDINASRVQVLITDQGQGLAWCLSAGQVTGSRLLDLRRERPSAVEEAPQKKIAMILDSNWCYTVPVTAESVELLKILTNGASRIITPPIDSRVVAFGGSSYSPLEQGADLAAAAGIEVIEQSLNETAEGFIWLPLLNPSERFTATELNAIKRNAPFGALLIGERTAWGGGATSYNGHLIELFQPGFAQTATGTEGDFQDLRVSANLTVTMAAIGYWDIDIPEELIIGTLINRPGDAPNQATGRPGAIWLD